MEHEPTEQSADVITFLDDLLDDRDTIDTQLNASHESEIHATYTDYQITPFRPTRELSVFFPFHTDGSSAELSCNFTQLNGKLAVKNVTLTAEDSAPLKITPYEDFCEIGDGVDIRNPTFYHEALLTILPENFRTLNPNDQQLLDFLAKNTPTTESEKVFHHQTEESLSYVVTTEHETIDDSIYTFQAIHLRPHPSGHFVGTRLFLAESLKKAAQAQTERKVTVDVIRNGLSNSPSAFRSIDSIYSGDVTSKDVSRITPTQMGDVLDALHYLRQSSQV